MKYYIPTYILGLFHIIKQFEGSLLINQPVLMTCRVRGFEVMKNNPGWLDYIGDEISPTYIGIMINHYKDPY